MARAEATDPLTTFKFGVEVVSSNGTNRLIPPFRAEGGFTQVGLPQATTDIISYREGNFVYTEKYPGIPSMADITLSRGLFRGDITLWEWQRQIMEGSGEYRADVFIKQFHREALRRGVPPLDANNRTNFTQFNLNETAAVTYILHEAFPSGINMGELNGSTGEITVNQLTLAFEYFEMINDPI